MSKQRKWAHPINDGTYGSWYSMTRRCSGRDAHSSHYAGTEVCERWKNFDAFYQDMGPRPLGATLDRKDNSKGYAPDNCRWATRQEQVDNRRNTIRLTHEGRTMTLQEWATQLKVPYYLLWNRVKAGLPTDDILTPKLRRSLAAEHGTVTKYAHGCRCTECKSARATWYRNHKERRNGAQT